MPRPNAADFFFNYLFGFTLNTPVSGTLSSQQGLNIIAEAESLISYPALASDGCPNL